MMRKSTGKIKNKKESRNKNKNQKRKQKRKSKIAKRSYNKTKINTENLKEIIIKGLPILLKKEPDIKNYIVSLFEDKFALKPETESRIERLYEEIKAMREESERRWEENQKRWEEITKRLEEHSIRLEEHSKRLEEHSRRLEEQGKRLEEQGKRLEELSRRLEELNRSIDELKEEIKSLRKTDEKLIEEIKALRKRQDVQIGALGARWGIKTERSFRNALKGILEESFPIKVERYEAFDDKGIVFDGHPGVVELDIIIKDNEIIVAELKSSISVGDVLLFEKKVKFFEEKEGRKPAKKIIISPMIEPKAEELIEKLGIIAYTDIPEQEDEI